MDLSEEHSESENASNEEHSESEYSDNEEHSESEYSANEEKEASSSEDDSSSDLEENEDGAVPKLADAEFKEMPFEDLLKLQKKLGSRMYNEAIFGKTIERKSNAVSTKSGKKLKKRAETSSSESDDDSGPEEVTSKRKVPALGMTKKKRKSDNQGPRDPRFDPNQGYFSGRQFRENYSFINDLRKKELDNLKRKLEAAADPEEAEKIKFVIQRTDNRIREYAKQKALDEERMREKQTTRQAIEEGKRPFYERKSTKQARALVEQYDKLKEDGQLAKHIDKRRRKVSAKDRKKLDFST